MRTHSLHLLLCAPFTQRPRRYECSLSNLRYCATQYQSIGSHRVNTWTQAIKKKLFCETVPWNCHQSGLSRHPPSTHGHCLLVSGHPSNEGISVIYLFVSSAKPYCDRAFFCVEDVHFYDKKQQERQLLFSGSFSGCGVKAACWSSTNSLEVFPPIRVFERVLKKSLFLKWKHVAKIVIWFCIYKTNFSLKQSLCGVHFAMWDVL